MLRKVEAAPRTGAAVRHDGAVVAVEDVLHDRRNRDAVQVRLARLRPQHRVEGEGAARDLRLAAAAPGLCRQLSVCLSFLEQTPLHRPDPEYVNVHQKDQDQLRGVSLTHSATPALLRGRVCGVSCQVGEAV